MQDLPKFIQLGKMVGISLCSHLVVPLLSLCENPSPREV